MIDVYPPTPRCHRGMVFGESASHLAMCKGNLLSGCLSSLSSSGVQGRRPPLRWLFDAVSAKRRVAWARILLVLRHNLAFCSFLFSFRSFFILFSRMFSGMSSLEVYKNVLTKTASKKRCCKKILSISLRAEVIHGQ